MSSKSWLSKYQGNHSHGVGLVHLVGRPTQLVGHHYPRPHPHSPPQSPMVSRSCDYESAYINIAECFKTLFRPLLTPLDSTRNRNPPNLNPYTCGGSKSQGFFRSRWHLLWLRDGHFEDVVFLNLTTHSLLVINPASLRVTNQVSVVWVVNPISPLFTTQSGASGSLQGPQRHIGTKGKE